MTKWSACSCPIGGDSSFVVHMAPFKDNLSDDPYAHELRVYKVLISSVGGVAPTYWYPICTATTMATAAAASSLRMSGKMKRNQRS